MCGDNRNLEEVATTNLIGVLGVDRGQLNAWARSHFDLTDDSWDPFGVWDPNDAAKPYGKMINAIFLIGYALSDNHDLQWHSTEDYETLSASGPNRFHGDMYLRIITAGSNDATAFTGQIGTDHTDMHCTVFRQGSRSNFASHRAGTMVHEAWHHWQYRNGFVGSHPSGGASSWPGGGDYLYFHGVGVFEFGSLHGWSTNPANFHFHSPYQVQAEFYADLAELSRPEVSTMITQTARDHGNAILLRAFVNAAGYRIGDPRPW